MRSDVSAGSGGNVIVDIGAGARNAGRVTTAWPLLN